MTPSPIRAVDDPAAVDIPEPLQSPLPPSACSPAGRVLEELQLVAEHGGHTRQIHGQVIPNFRYWAALFSQVYDRYLSQPPSALSQGRIERFLAARKSEALAGVSEAGPPQSSPACVQMVTVEVPAGCAAVPS